MKSSPVFLPLRVRRIWSGLSFQSRVLLVFVGLLMLALFSASTAMFFAANRTSLGLAEQQLWVTDRLVQETLGYRDQQLRESTTALAADFGFREAVASNDRPTISSALANQGARVNADVALLMDDGGTVTATTGASTDVPSSSSLIEALNQVRAHHVSPAIMRTRGGLLQMVIVPLRGPDIIGWVGMGFLIRDDVVQRIKETAGADVSLFTGTSETSPSVVASTLPAGARSALTSHAAAIMGGTQAIRPLGLNGEDYLTLSTAGSSSVNEPFWVVMQMPMSTVVAPMDALRRQLLISGGIIMMLSLVAAVLSARLLAQPVRALADAARSLTMSKRRTLPVAGQRDDELAHVAEAFHALAHRAHYDSLTGLPNRTLLMNRLSESLARMNREKLPLAVVFIDLNGFKSINDTLGHEMGDLVLRKTAQRLAQSVTTPHMVARLGGDEFVLVLEGEAESAALKTVERLSDVISTPMKAPGGSIKVGMSAGIAMYPELSTDRESLLKHADAAMYQSKTQKRGPVIAKPSPAAPAGLPGESPARPARDLSGDSTMSNQWEGKDLATHVTKVLPSVDSSQSVKPVQKTFMPARVPADEAERLAVLRGIRILDSPSSALYDRIIRLAAKALDVPIVLISLVDEKRQWFLARSGIDAAETPRDVSFCAHAVYERKPLIVSDASVDPRFAGNPLVTGDPHILAYVGVPIYSSGGLPLGTLCAIDRRARNFSEQNVSALQDFTSIIEDYIHARERRIARPRHSGGGHHRKTSRRSKETHHG